MPSSLHLPCAASDNCSLCPDIDGRTYTRSNRSQLQTTPASAEYTKVHTYQGITSDNSETEYTLSAYLDLGIDAFQTIAKTKHAMCEPACVYA